MVMMISSQGQSYAELYNWGDCVGSTLINLDFVAKDTNFSGSYSYLSAGENVSARLFGTAHRTARSQRRVRETDNDFILLIYVKTGMAMLSHRHFSSHVSPGSFVAIDSSSPHELTMTESFDHFALRMSKTRFLSLHPASSAILQEPIQGKARELNAAAGILEMMASLGGAMPSTLSTMSEAVVRLIGDWIVESEEHAKAPAWRHDLLLRRLIKHVDENLTDPAYSSSRLAAAMGISRRYVDSLFAGANSTFGKMLLEKRLERCYRLLADPRHAGRSVTDIAFETGFNDLSHFSRRFRERFNLAPREVRQAAKPMLN